MTTHFYRVNVFMTTFGKEPYFSHDEEFKGPDLLECRNKAIEYYKEQQYAIEERGHFWGKKFEGYNNFKRNENAAYSITLQLIESYQCKLFGEEIDGEIIYTIAGEGEEETSEALRYEKEIFTKIALE